MAQLRALDAAGLDISEADAANSADVFGPAKARGPMPGRTARWMYRSVNCTTGTAAACIAATTSSGPERRQLLPDDGKAR